jgi:hypothetical protein
MVVMWRLRRMKDEEDEEDEEDEFEIDLPASP